MGDALAVDDLGAPNSVLRGETVPRQDNLIRVPQLVGADDLLTARNGESRVSSDRGAVTLGDETPLPRHRVDLVEHYEVRCTHSPGERSSEHRQAVAQRKCPVWVHPNATRTTWTHSVRLESSVRLS
jgi:hypothetical protein